MGRTIARTRGLNSATMRGGGELAVAAAQVAMAAQWLTEKNAGTGLKTVLAGESAGGYIAALACHSFCTKNLLLVAPLLQSPAEFWKNFARQADKSTTPFYVDNSKGSSSPADAERVAEAAAIGFYGEDYRDMTLLDLLKGVPVTNEQAPFRGRSRPPDRRREGCRDRGPTGLPEHQGHPLSRQRPQGSPGLSSRRGGDNRMAEITH